MYSALNSQMERQDNANNRSCYRRVCSLLLMLVGFLSCLIIVVLVYFTYEAASGRMDVCTLWTDVPGRLSIFVTCYYMAGICGCLPIPRCCLLSWLPEPFLCWRLSSWRNLCRNLCSRISFCIEKWLSPDLPLLDALSERDYYDSFFTPRIQPTFVRTYSGASDSHMDTQTTEMLPGMENPIVCHSNESFLHIESYLGDCIVPGMESSSKKHYLSASSSSGSESFENRAVVTQSEESKKSDRTSSSTPEEDVQLPNFPRIPWSYLRNPGGIGETVRELHEKNLKEEKCAIESSMKKETMETERELAIGVMRERETSKIAELPANKDRPREIYASRNAPRVEQVTEKETDNDSTGVVTNQQLQTERERSVVSRTAELTSERTEKASVIASDDNINSVPRRRQKSHLRTFSHRYRTRSSHRASTIRNIRKSRLRRYKNDSSTSKAIVLGEASLDLVESRLQFEVESNEQTIKCPGDLPTDESELPDSHSRPEQLNIPNLRQTDTEKNQRDETSEGSTHVPEISTSFSDARVTDQPDMEVSISPDDKSEDDDEDAVFKLEDL